jgi:hypothetical protein
VEGLTSCEELYPSEHRYAIEIYNGTIDAKSHFLAHTKHFNRTACIVEVIQLHDETLPIKGRIALGEATAAQEMTSTARQAPAERISPARAELVVCGAAALVG